MASHVSRIKPVQIALFHTVLCDHASASPGSALAGIIHWPSFSLSHLFAMLFPFQGSTHISPLEHSHTHTHTHTHTIASSFSFFRLQLKYHPLKRLSLRPTCKIIYFTCFFLLPIISITIMYNHTTYTFLCVLHIKITHITT